MVEFARFCAFLSSSSSSDPLVLWSDGSASARCSAGVGAEVGVGQRRAALLSLRGFLALGSGLSFLVLALGLPPLPFPFGLPPLPFGLGVESESLVCPVSPMRLQPEEDSGDNIWHDCRAN